MSTAEDQHNYVKTTLIHRIADKFPNEKISSYELSHSSGLDGFMSAIYTLDIKTVDQTTKREKLYNLIVKFMKSDVSFRKLSKSYEQFANEIFIYGKVLPYYEQMAVAAAATKSSLTTKSDMAAVKATEMNESSINVKNWTPRTFYAEYGLIEGLSDGKSDESVLVLANLKPLRYRGGPRCFLDRQHLLLSIKTLSEYHAFTYAMQARKDPMLSKFIEEIIPISFIKCDTTTTTTTTEKETNIKRRTTDETAALCQRTSVVKQKTSEQKSANKNDNKRSTEAVDVATSTDDGGPKENTTIKNQNIRKRKLPTDVNYDKDDLDVGIITSASSTAAATVQENVQTLSDAICIDDGTTSPSTDNDDDTASDDNNVNISNDGNDDEGIKRAKKSKLTQIDSGSGNNLYGVLYRVAFDRFFMFIEKMEIAKACIVDEAGLKQRQQQQQKKQHQHNEHENICKYVEENMDQFDDEFFDTLKAFKSKWFDKPTELLEYIRCNCIDDYDDVFAVILHGDFNRNNLLYQYEKAEGFDNPTAVKMIDFQELRYGTPALDLGFHMYMNMDPSIRDEFWMELLQSYHAGMIDTLAHLLNVDVQHKSLDPYRFEAFNEHFAKYAFYGALVCMHFMPWMTCSEQEVAKLSHHFETDMHSNDFRQISIEAGGMATDKLIVQIVQHAIKMGYMKNLL